MGNIVFLNSNCNFTVIEGRKIEVGNNCLLTTNVNIQCGDGHSIYDMNGKCVNKTLDITIGNHTWIGKNVMILKGCIIPDNTVVGANSVVTKQFNEENVIIVGNPA